MKTDYIDYIIPFHRSQIKTKDFGKLDIQGNDDFTVIQLEKIKDPKTGRWRNSRNAEERKLIPSVDDWWDYDATAEQNARNYLKLCHERGIKPKFIGSIGSKAKGTQKNVNLAYETDDASVIYSETLPIREGYVKLLVDFRRYDNSGKAIRQQPVVPNFNVNVIKEMLDAYKYEGSPTDANYKNDAVQEIVDEFISKFGDKKPTEADILGYKGEYNELTSIRNYNEDATEDVERLYGVRESRRSGNQAIDAADYTEEADSAKSGILLELISFEAYNTFRDRVEKLHNGKYSPEGKVGNTYIVGTRESGYCDIIFIWTDGDSEDPSVEKIVEVNAYAKTDISKVIKYVKSEETSRHSSQSRNARKIFSDGTFVEFTRQDIRYIREHQQRYRNLGKTRRKNKQNIGYDQNGRRNTSKSTEALAGYEGEDIELYESPLKNIYYVTLSDGGKYKFKKEYLWGAEAYEFEDGRRYFKIKDMVLDQNRRISEETKEESTIRESRKSTPTIPDGHKERGFNESVHTKSDYDKVIQQEFIDFPEIYKQLANKVTIAKAKAIMDKGLAFAEAEFPKLLERMDATAIALGDLMAREYSNMGEYDKAVTVIRDMARQLTKAGQFSQAAVIALTKSNPMTALAYAKRDIAKMNTDGHIVLYSQPAWYDVCEI